MPVVTSKDLLFSFEKSLRLLNKNDFQSLKTGSRFFASDILIFFVKPNDLGHDRIGIAVSKKYGNAVHRNKIKRLIRETFRKEKMNFCSVDILVCMNLKKIKKSKLKHESVASRVGDSLKTAYTKQFKK